MKTHWLLLHTYLISTLNGMVSFAPRPLYSGERAASAQHVGGLVDPRLRRDTVPKRKIPNLSLTGFKPQSSRLQPNHYTD
jgi:hypothetical protein